MMMRQNPVPVARHSVAVGAHSAPSGRGGALPSSKPRQPRRALRTQRPRRAALPILALALLAPAGARAIDPDQEVAWHATSIPAGDQPFEVLTADLDADGDIDLAVTDTKDSAVSIYLGNGDGTFAPRTSFPTGEFPRGIVAADFNRDGRLDLATAATHGGGMFVHDGLGGGRFAAGRLFRTGTRPFHAITADWNADGIPDIGMANEQKNVSILIGDGKGGFTVRAFEVGKYPSNVAAADWNEDGHLDWASTNWGDNNVSVRFGTGSGADFPERRDFTYNGHALFGILGADLDQDDHQDMVWNDIERYGFWILYGDGTGSFPRTKLVPAGGGVRSIRAVDITADGWLDLISADTASGNASIALADGNGGYLPTQSVPVGVKPRVVSVADLNGDQRPDLVITNMDSDSLTILTQTGVQPRPTAPLDPGPVETKRILALVGLKAPSAVILDSKGNLLIADQQHHRVMRAAPADGSLTTVAGTGQSDFQGDGGLAIDAGFRLPSSLVLDHEGNLLVADFDNNRIRKIDPSGVVTTIAGNGEAAYAGDGGPATAAALYRPFSLALGAGGTLYFVDLQNNRIRKIDPSGTISTVAGTGTFGIAGDGGPAGAAQIGPVTRIAVDRQGTIYIADQLNARIRAIDPGGTMRTVASNVGQPTAITADSSGTVYFATAQRIARLTPQGAAETVIDLTAAQQSRALHGAPSSLAVAADGTFYVADSAGNVVSRIDRNGAVKQISPPPATPAAR